MLTEPQERKLLTASVVKRILKYKKSGDVIDLGSGDGRNTLFLAKKGFRVTAIDIDEGKLAELRKKAKNQSLKVLVRRADVSKIKLQKRYDIIVCTMVLHFLGKSKILKIIKKLKARTKRDGLNIVSVHTDKNDKHSRAYLFSKDELKAYYSDWKILHYWEGLGKAFFSKSGKKLKKYRAEVIALKY